MQIPIRVALVASAAIVLAACGSVAAPPGASGQPAVQPKLVVTEPSKPAGSEPEAMRLARLLLSRLRLPSGARQLRLTVVSPSPRNSAGPPGPDNAADLHTVFRLRQPMEEVAAYLSAHVPAHMTRSGVGSASGPGGTTMEFVAYTPAAVPAGIYLAQVTVTVVPRRAGGALVRADAQVIWYPPRSAAEYITAGRFHALTITVSYGTPRHTTRVIVTSAAAIRRVASGLNMSRVEPVTNVNCALIIASYRLAFAVSPHSQPAIVVSATSAPCGGAAVVAAGQAQPPLANAGQLVRLANRLLGVNPWAARLHS